MRAIYLYAATIGCALAIAACGSSGSKPRHSGKTAFVAFSVCMRSHGVPNFPDPSGGGGINLDGTNVNPASPAFVAARETCKKTLPGGGPPASNAAAAAHFKAQLVAAAQCMRAHGITGFPDPTNSPPPNVNSGAYSIVEGEPGVFLAVPSSIDASSPAFKHAARACNFQ